jgi:hypothetical protein
VRLGKLDIGDNRKFIQTGFFGWATYIEEVLRLNGVDLRNDAEYAATLRKFRGGGLTAVEQLDQTPKLLAIAEKRLEEERGRVMRFFAQEQAQIEKAKQYALSVRLAELETTLMADQQKPAKTAPAGMVTAVVYSADARTALVGSTAARKGDKIGDIQVVDISEDTVTFQVGDRKWTQRVGEAPPAQWR